MDAHIDTCSTDSKTLSLEALKESHSDEAHDDATANEFEEEEEEEEDGEGEEERERERDGVDDELLRICSSA